MPRSKAFFLRMTQEDIDLLQGIAEDEQRPYTQVAALLIHGALRGYGASPRRMSVLAFCRLLERGAVTNATSGRAGAAAPDTTGDVMPHQQQGDARARP